MALWRIAVEVPAAAVDAYAAALDAVCASVSWFGEGEGPWCVEGWCAAPPDRPGLAVALAVAAAATGCGPVAPVVEAVPHQDWLAKSLQQFAPVTVGRFWLRGSHDRSEAPAGAIAIVVDAATAFGSGRHPTTAGCLEAITGLARGRRVRRALDMGCGSGILAVAMARLWRRPVVAVDVDAEAVIVTGGNARENGVGGLVRTARADGYRSTAVADGAPYDLIVANILARPLRRMARDLMAHLAPGGVAVLSGFVAADANAVLAAHRRLGARLRQRLTRDGWTTLIVTAPPRRPPAANRPPSARR